MKIGIITMFYKNYNYGGVLQSYALCKAVNNILGEDGKATQLCFDIYSAKSPKIPQEPRLKRLLKAPWGEKFKLLKTFFGKKNRKKEKNKDVSELINKRKSAFDDFVLKHIPYSKKIYNYDSISQTNQDFDAFITGSDQVWNPLFYNPAYFLDFALEDKFKASYAASVSQNYLSDNQKRAYREHLKRFDKISLRENNLGLIQQLTEKDVQWVLDPTLLLDREDWDTVCPSPLVEEKYLFCYFLSDDEGQRKLAIQYAKEHNLKLVTLPYLLNKYRKCDENFGDISLFDISPADFISLIKNAEMVFTDSFHATVFSCIYQKNFFVFSRKGFSEMQTRITSLLEVFDAQDRFCNTKKRLTLKYINETSDKKFLTRYEKLNLMKEKSIGYIQDLIKGINNKLNAC